MCAKIELIRDNVVPLALVLVSAVITRRIPGRVLPLLVIAGCIVAVEAAWLVLLPSMANHLGILAGFNFSRFSLYMPWFLVICGALCMDSVEESWRLGVFKGEVVQRICKVKTLLVALAVGVVILQSLVVQGQIILEAAEGNTFANFYRHRALELLKTKKDSDRPFRVATVVEGYRNCPHPAFVWVYGLESVDGYLTIYPRRYQEYWGEVLAPLTAANDRIKTYFWSWGCRLYLFSPNFFTPAAQHAQEKPGLSFSNYYNLNLLSLGNTKYIASPIPIHHESLQLVHSPTEEQIAWRSNPSRFDKVMKFVGGKSPGFTLYVYENLLALPRFSLMGGVLVFENKKEILDALGKADAATLSSHAFVLESDIRGLPLKELRGSKGNVTIQEYSFDQIRLTTNSESAAILFTASTWSPYWKAWVDGVETQVFPADHAFQGVYCPPGSHEVILRYIPPFGQDSVKSRAIPIPKA